MSWLPHPTAAAWGLAHISNSAFLQLAGGSIAFQPTGGTWVGLMGKHFSSVDVHHVSDMYLVMSDMTNLFPLWAS